MDVVGLSVREGAPLGGSGVPEGVLDLLKGRRVLGRGLVVLWLFLDVGIVYSGRFERPALHTGIQSRRCRAVWRGQHFKQAVLAYDEGIKFRGSLFPWSSIVMKLARNAQVLLTCRTRTMLY